MPRKHLFRQRKTHPGDGHQIKRIVLSSWETSTTVQLCDEYTSLIQQLLTPNASRVPSAHEKYGVRGIKNRGTMNTTKLDLQWTCW